MAPKRRAVSVETDSDTEQAQSTKRARINGDTNGVAAASGSRPRARRANEQEDDNEPIVVDEEDDIQDVAPNEDDEKQFEEQHEEMIRAKVMNTSKTLGSIAEMGIIEKLELHQFMCHKYLEFTFGPQINFIIGHNGSGKSAVLSALTVALGGKANVTGRGSGLKSFIREGQGAAEVSVTLKNQGDDAYRHKDYGDSIIITRRFTKEGSSSYKIKSKEGKVISTKRDELSAICDHMNIQVDNPMNILTQDSARQFLSASQPADKYRFFLRGTQLSQLSEEYSTCLENISQTQKILKTKLEVLPDLEDALEEALGRFKEAEKARDMKHKADDLKKELAWAHVATKEQELFEKVEHVERCKAKIPKIEEKLQEAEMKLLAAEGEIVEAELRVAELGDMTHLQAQSRELHEKLNEGKKKLSKIKDDEREMNRLKIACDAKIAEYQKAIEDEQRRIEEFSHDKREAAQRKLEEAIQELQNTEELLRKAREERNQAEQESRETFRQYEQLKNQQVMERQNEINEINRQLDLLSRSERDKLLPFGKNMEQVLAEIGRQQWHGQQPVGPLGRFVRVRDQAWAPLMRVRLGGLMSAFAVTDARDRKALDAILRRYGNNPQIIISEVDMFDYSRGEPPERFLTALRVLDVSDPYVLRVLINSASIETMLVAHSRREADEKLQDLGHGVAWTSDAYTVERFRGGGGRSNLAPQLRPSDPRNQLFTSGDHVAEKGIWEQRLKEAEAKYAEVVARRDELSQKGRALDAKVKQLKAEENRLIQLARSIKMRRDALQDEANEQLPVGVQSIQTMLEEQIAARENVMAQFREAAAREQEVIAEQRPIQEERARVKAQIEAYSARHKELTDEAQDAVEKRIKAQHEKAHFTKRLEAENEKVLQAQELADQVQEEFKQWTAKAELFCNREEIPNPRKVDELQRLLDSVQRALKEREKRQGASVEQMAIEVNKKRTALETARKDLKIMLQLNKSLRKSIRIRLARWHEFRRHIALRCKIYFSYHLSNRGYFGKVLFDHVAGTLTLKVQTDDQAGTQGSSREKDPRSLSGGEKSFSTICLLLSLWESIGCPIRCLDEFDVFMDAVNRRISMRMMIDTANASDRKQYILITPQDMTNITIGNTVRVHRMSDPERGQGLLSFRGQ